MTTSLRKLLAGVFDYAGLFPPTALPMGEAVARYARFPSGPEAWLVRRFVCEIARLPELLQAMPQAGHPWEIAALGSSINDFKADLQRIQDFEADAQDRASVTAIEVKLGDAHPMNHDLHAMADSGFDDVYIEVRWSEDMIETLHKIAETDGVGVKLRTGGAGKAYVPSPLAVSSFIQEATNLDLRFKFTAGLHHPLHGHDDEEGSRMYGFVNVLVASVLARAHDLSRREIQEVLTCEDFHRFWFTDLGLGFGDWEATIAEIEDFRAGFGSIGSCSIDEPLDGLADLGWIAREERV